MDKLKIGIKSIFGKLLFEYEAENNTLVKTIHEANLRGANLCGANLYGANLRGANLYEADLRGANLRGANLYEADLYEANLRGANLRGADLYEANLRGANLRGANLRGADLRGANLRGANLYEADLRGANLRGANLYEADLRGAENTEEATLPMFCKWGVGIKGAHITIGCKSKSIEEWDSFFASGEEYDTPRGSSEFKQIQAVYEAHKAYINFLKNFKL